LNLYDFNGVNSEICCVCGRDVSRRSPLFVNRVPEGNDLITRLDIGREYPFGDWVCIICDNTDSDGEIHNMEDIEFSIRSARELITLIEHYFHDKDE
jgi:hypothetical protein